MWHCTVEKHSWSLQCSGIIGSVFHSFIYIHTDTQKKGDRMRNDQSCSVRKMLPGVKDTVTGRMRVCVSPSLASLRYKVKCSAGVCCVCA